MVFQPHKLLRQVVKATYHQLWWPAHDEPLYTDVLPVWDHQVEGYVDPDTGQLLPTFEQALADLDADPHARPAHVLWFGTRMDSQGLIATQADAGRRVRYLTKYLTKSIAEGIGDPDDMTPRQLAHLERLHEEVRWLPCTERCWNWLRYGIQPEDAESGMEPGHCPNKAHDRDHLGVGGRRTLVSRKWTRGSGPARPWPTTVPTAPPSSPKSSTPPASTCPTSRPVRQPPPAPTAGLATDGTPCFPVTRMPLPTGKPLPHLSPSDNAGEARTRPQRPRSSRPRSVTRQPARRSAVTGVVLRPEP